MEFAPSAFKHGLDEDDVAHAMNNAMVVEELDDDLRLYLGPDRSAAFLEVITLLREEPDDELVVHAMPMRPKYQRLLPGGDR